MQSLRQDQTLGLKMMDDYRFFEAEGPNLNLYATSKFHLKGTLTENLTDMNGYFGNKHIQWDIEHGTFLGHFLWQHHDIWFQEYGKRLPRPRPL